MPSLNHPFSWNIFPTIPNLPCKIKLLSLSAPLCGLNAGQPRAPLLEIPGSFITTGLREDLSLPGRQAIKLCGQAAPRFSCRGTLVAAVQASSTSQVSRPRRPLRRSRANVTPPGHVLPGTASRLVADTQRVMLLYIVYSVPGLHAAAYNFDPPPTAKGSTSSPILTYR